MQSINPTVTDALQDIVLNLAVTNKNLVSHLSALGECALSCPDAFENKGEKIIEFILKKVINAESPSIEVSPTIPFR